MNKLRELSQVTSAPAVADKRLLGVPAILTGLLVLSVIGSFAVMEPVIRTYVALWGVAPFWAYVLFYSQVAMTILAIPALLRLRMPELLRIISILVLALTALFALVSLPLQLFTGFRLSSFIINAVGAALIVVSLIIIRADISLRSLQPSSTRRG